VVGLSRSERIVLCLLAVAILAGRLVRDHLERPEDLIVFADSAKVDGNSGTSGLSDKSARGSNGSGNAVSGERQDPPGENDANSGRAGDDVPAAPSFPIDLNRATETDLVALPGIGPTKARAIVEWRAAHGPFGRVEQLLEVPGIGPKTAAQLSGFVVVKAAKSAQGGSR
jgi:competence ComEA-like helix-hairpin-helix protein